jgi:hypothetical protein
MEKENAQSVNLNHIMLLIHFQKDREINGKEKGTISESESHHVADSFSNNNHILIGYT